jgi:hypothetical protein
LACSPETHEKYTELIKEEGFSNKYWNYQRRKMLKG